ncbi:MAG: hypothetical protein E7653_03940 [Ruminococcaceae bacterium]|nr:hypothetical protein [Oscillospiraceae bacterium]
MEKSKPKSFVLYNSYKNQFEQLNMKQRGELITAIFNYVESGSPGISLTSTCKMAFSVIASTLDRDREKYEMRCAVNRENAKKGGRPPKTDRLPKKPKKPYNDNDNNNDNDIDIDNDNEHDLEAWLQARLKNTFGSC